MARPVVSFDGVAVVALAGEGVAGTAMLFVRLARCAGAAGGAGVAVVAGAGAGVDGALGADEDAAGAALGYNEC